MRKRNLLPQHVWWKIEMRLLLQEEQLRGQQEASSNYFLIGYESKCPWFLKLHSCSPLTSNLTETVLSLISLAQDWNHTSQSGDQYLTLRPDTMNVDCFGHQDMSVN